jgi:hypothetical protein
MKRRDFIGTPLALVALGAGSLASRSAQAATTRTPVKTPLAQPMVLMRLADSTGKSSDEKLIDSPWQTTWSTRGAVKRARLVLQGMVRGSGSTLGQVNVEAVYFDAANGVNSCVIYQAAAGNAAALSKGVGLDVSSTSFGGFALSGIDRSRTVSALGTQAIGDNATGLLMPGQYVLMLPTAKQSVTPVEYQFSTYLDRPLMRRDGRLPDVDYFAFSIAAA